MQDLKVNEDNKTLGTLGFLAGIAYLSFLLIYGVVGPKWFAVISTVVSLWNVIDYIKKG